MLQHRHISDGVFARFNIALIRLIGERYEQEDWDDFHGNSHDHIAVIQVGKEHFWVVKKTQDFEVFYIMTTPRDFFLNYIL